jgi:hypothetical protein
MYLGVDVKPAPAGRFEKKWGRGKFFLVGHSREVVPVQPRDNSNTCEKPTGEEPRARKRASVKIYTHER